MEKHILELKNVFVTAETKSGSSTIIQDIGFTADKGDRLAIVGESGCGKTMTAMAIFGLLPGNCHAAGKIYLNGNNLWVWSKMPDDRESNFAGSGNQGAYPTVKRFNLGVKFTL